MGVRVVQPRYGLRRIAVAIFASYAITAFAVSESLTYTVVPGDTLSGIGQRLLIRPTDWRKLQTLNRIEDPDRLNPEQKIAIPLRLLRRVPMSAQLAHVAGGVRSGSDLLGPGAELTENTFVTTEENSFATLKMPDGSVVRLQPRTTFRMTSNRQLGTSSAYDIRLELKAGRIESEVAKVRKEGGNFEISSPNATVGIRGTSLRVATDGGSSSAVELTEGEVGVLAGQSKQASKLRAGNGWFIDAGQDKAHVVPLLPPPDMTRIAPLYERIKVGFPIAPMAGAVRYRAQVAADEAFSSIIAESLFEQGEAKFTGLEDGTYWVRIRAIDSHGLEGRDGQARFRLKARPEPPFASAPVNGGKVWGGKVRFAWSASDVSAYRFQLARDPEFKDRLAEFDKLHQTEFDAPVSLEPGQYYWRVGSVRSDGDMGPFGDPNRFSVKPEMQVEAPEIKAGEMTFAWSGETGQVFDFELAKDADFKTVIETRRLDQARVALPKPGPGTYFMRVRPTDPDGFVGPYSATQRFDIPMPWWLLLVFLAPLI